MMFQYLDSEIVDELSEIMGDDLGALFETYIQDSEGKVEEICRTPVDGKGESIRRLAHSLKGSSRNVGANQLADQCEYLERAARNGELELCESLKSVVQNEFQAVKNEINQIYLTR